MALYNWGKGHGVSPLQLNKEQLQAAIQKISANWADRPCEGCGTRDWDIDNHVFQITEFYPDAMIRIGGSVRVPFIIAACKKCGLIRSVNAIQLGVIDVATGKLIDVK